MNFEQQVTQHLQFLQKKGHEVKNLMIDSPEFIRSQANGALGRGEYAYKTVSRRLNNGMIGLMTWCRSESGQINTYKTYGYASDNIEGEKNNISVPTHLYQPITKEKASLDMERIRKFWELSSQYGKSDYLTRKGVGLYDIRFRENQYGRVAVVPMRDIQGTLQSYQILNSNGSKVFAKGVPLTGLFHQLDVLTDDSAIGIAESYVTAATCQELAGIPMVTAFTSDNIVHVATVLKHRYPRSPLVLFADNDKHIRENKGMLSALKALEKIKGNGIILAPRFKNSPQLRDYSDWNDLVREQGRVSALEQIWVGLSQAQDERIRRFCI